ncbi:MAG: hypothetical protein ALAOOOJD_02152 [bacterium]|nr:hypothetical protein [bacterium]
MIGKIVGLQNDVIAAHADLDIAGEIFENGGNFCAGVGGIIHLLRLGGIRTMDDTHSRRDKDGPKG